MVSALQVRYSLSQSRQCSVRRITVSRRYHLARSAGCEKAHTCVAQQGESLVFVQVRVVMVRVQVVMEPLDAVKAMVNGHSGVVATAVSKTDDCIISSELAKLFCTDTNTVIYVKVVRLVHDMRGFKRGRDGANGERGAPTILEPFPCCFKRWSWGAIEIQGGLLVVQASVMQIDGLAVEFTLLIPNLRAKWGYFSLLAFNSGLIEDQMTYFQSAACLLIQSCYRV